MPPFRIRFKFNKLINNLLQRLCFGVLFENFNRWKMNIYKQICFIDPPILTYTHKKKMKHSRFMSRAFGWEWFGSQGGLKGNSTMHSNKRASVPSLQKSNIWSPSLQKSNMWSFRVCISITRTQEPWFFLLLFCIYISEVIEEQKFDNWQNKQHKAKEKEEGWA